MKSYKFTIKGVVTAVAAVGLLSCSDSVGEDEDFESDYDYTSVIDAYVDDVVVPTYADMKDNAWVLLEKVNAFNATQSQVNLDAVCAAWLEVRAPWELSEAFLFGPCGENGLNVDPNIDTWPFAQQDFDGIISSETEPLTVAAVSGYNETLRGYHTIEYLIFADGRPKTYTSVNSRQREYLVSAATVLRNDCIRVWAAWHGMAGIGSDDLGAINAMKAIQVGAGKTYWDVEDYLSEKGITSYAEAFKQAKSPYTSQYNVIEEIIDGCYDIAAEVSDGKILAPYEGETGEGQDPTLVESRFAHNSRQDFINNIRGIRNAYYGTRDQTTIAEGSLAAYLKEQPGGEELHGQIEAAIQDAIDKITLIPAPFINNLNAATQITAAAGACTDVGNAMLEIKKKLQ